tara:strand:+ start:9726 stop:10094 length:369 start_codon:yes stop_codon:yes gene_type:complete
MIGNYLLLSIIFVLVDSVYLTLTSGYFNNQIKNIQGSNLNLKVSSTILCYLALTLGIYYFSILKKISLLETFFLGIFVYGVFEFTNHAIFKNWKWSTVLMDTLWGGILFSSVVFLYRKIDKN